MRTVELKSPGKSSVKNSSVLGLGCASMLGRAGRRESLAALNAAYDAGITFFDTARSYGYGACEGLLGEFFHGPRRDSVVICTKFGIVPGSPGGWKNRIKPLARAVLSVAPQLRGIARKQAATQFNPGQFSLETLTSSFETSLRELQTDYVDILLMHSPPLSALHQDDLLEAMGRLVQQGKVRIAGASVEGEVISAMLSDPPSPLTSAQFALNPFSMGITAETEKAAKSLLLIANHPFGGLEGITRCRTEIDRMRQESELSQSLREKLDLHDETLLPELVLNCILNGTGVSLVIPSMLQPKHLKTNVRAVENCRFSPAELDLIRSRFARLNLATSH